MSNVLGHPVYAVAGALAFRRQTIAKYEGGVVRIFPEMVGGPDLSTTPGIAPSVSAGAAGAVPRIHRVISQFVRRVTIFITAFCNCGSGGPSLKTRRMRAAPRAPTGNRLYTLLPKNNDRLGIWRYFAKILPDLHTRFFSADVINLPIIIYTTSPRFDQARSQDCKFGAASVFGGQTYFEYYYTAIAC